MWMVARGRGSVEDFKRMGAANATLFSIAPPGRIFFLTLLSGGCAPGYLTAALRAFFAPKYHALARLPYRGPPGRPIAVESPAPGRIGTIWPGGPMDGSQG